MSRSATLFFAALFLATAVPMHASIAAAASFDEKVDNAASIVLGKCIRTESRFDPTGRWIVTYSTFQVEESLKGNAGATVTVVTPGGAVNGIHQSSVGIPSFRTGSENVLFIKNTKLGPTVLYFDQGAYDVRRGEQGEPLIAPVASDLVHIDTQRGVAVPSEQPRTLQDFKENVNRLLRSAAERHQRMALIAAAEKHPQSTLAAIWINNKILITAAVIGLLFAAWQAWRR